MQTITGFSFSGLLIKQKLGDLPLTYPQEPVSTAKPVLSQATAQT